jgi:NADPH:quinone reductase-like Zn-dependent oxidoreductase
MKAIRWHQYGPPTDVLRLEDVPTPRPKPGQVLVNVHAASVNAGDWHIVRADPWLARLAAGLLRPKHPIPSADIAGRVEAVGGSVTRFRAGDAVFGDLSACGFGAFAEYVCAPQGALAIKPANLGFEEAAAVPMAGVTALQACEMQAGSSLGRRCSFMAPPAAWAPSPCRSPRPWGRK